MDYRNEYLRKGKTTTGEWTQGNKVITMGFDRMGRRVFYKEMEGTRQITHTVFLYNGYLCIQQLFSNSPWNVYKEFVWDPTEPLATRPLCFRQNGQRATFLPHVLHSHQHRCGAKADKGNARHY